jgi:5-methylcytosine-specific restriction protein A
MKRRESRHQRGYTSKWDKARKEYLATHRTCVADGCDKPATDVDHIQPWRNGNHKDWTLFWDKGNWQSLCHSHHSIKTRAENIKLRSLRGGCDVNGMPLVEQLGWTVAD